MVADAACHGKPLRKLGENVTFTTRLPRSALHGHHPADIDDRRECAPWYTTKSDPAFSDMLAKLRRVIIAARFLPNAPDQPTDDKIRAVHQAWASAGHDLAA